MAAVAAGQQQDRGIQTGAMVETVPLMAAVAVALDNRLIAAWLELLVWVAAVCSLSLTTTPIHLLLHKGR